MANPVFLPKRSNTASAVPTTSNLIDGELAINSADKKVFLRAGSNIVEIAGAPSNYKLNASATTTSAELAQVISDETGSGKLVFDTSPTLAEVIITSNTSANALRITQTGTGNALVVEDEANPDSTPFVVTATGSVGVGFTTATEKLDVNGKIKTNDSVLISDSQIKTTTTTRTASSSQFTADTFSALTYRSTKYLVEIRETATSNFYTSELLLMHDGSEIYLTEYGTLQTPVSPVLSIDADINSNNVRLLITPSVANTITKISRISLTA